ncbi:MAG: UDP-3-O-[3-hydroxymyristoyl] N-acetylglucosamine deacetylase [Deltaproteobacteria bacterium]|nr:MAG: UDP-3-O-[3-hydroxymyristoyl] N-acetylglucosamine deacetylase [Deltaproteobacteria bacterium]
MEAKILIVDDEEAVIKAIAGALEDEGYLTLTARDGREALEIYRREGADVVLLDIWMPDIDGLDLLRRIKDVDDGCPVIMISGHATVSTAVKAMKMGAFDFLEKPLSVEALLGTVERALRERKAHPVQKGLGSETIPKRGPSQGEAVGRGKVVQRTLRRSAVLYGTGLHSGQKTGLILVPQPPNTGILFCDLAEDVVIPGDLDHVVSTDFATSVGDKGVLVRTIEHLMAVLHAYGVSNLLIKVNGEVPIMDGSALEFCKLLEEIGLQDQEEGLEEIELDRKYELKDGDRFISIEPADHLEIDFTLQYPPPVGLQRVRFTLDGPDSFKEEIAPARTYAFLKDVEKLSKMGLAGGGHLHNVVLLDDRGVINTTLRFPDELVRHKVLDLLGDLYLLNRPVKGKVTARMTGHRENVGLLRLVKEGLGL